jgi:hypothetical protein
MSGFVAILGLVLTAISTIAGVAGAVAAIAQLRHTRSTSARTREAGPPSNRRRRRRGPDDGWTGYDVYWSEAEGQDSREYLSFDTTTEPPKRWWNRPRILAVLFAATAAGLWAALVLGRQVWSEDVAWLAQNLSWIAGLAVALGAISVFPAERGSRGFRDVGLVLIAVVINPGTVITVLYAWAFYDQIIRPIFAFIGSLFRALF